MSAAADDQPEPPSERPEGEIHSLIVDRFEGDLAVVQIDGRRFADLPRWLLPSAVREGDWLRMSVVSGGEADQREIRVRVDSVATRAARAEAYTLLDRLRGRGQG